MGSEESGTHFHSATVALSLLYPGHYLSNLNAVEVDKMTVKGLVHRVFRGWMFHSFTQTESLGLKEWTSVVQQTGSFSLICWLRVWKVVSRAWSCRLRVNLPITLRSPQNPGVDMLLPGGHGQSFLFTAPERSCPARSVFAHRRRVSGFRFRLEQPTVMALFVVIRF